MCDILLYKSMFYCANLMFFYADLIHAIYDYIFTYQLFFAKNFKNFFFICIFSPLHRTNVSRLFGSIWQLYVHIKYLRQTSPCLQKNRLYQYIFKLLRKLACEIVVLYVTSFLFHDVETCAPYLLCFIWFSSCVVQVTVWSLRGIRLAYLVTKLT